MNLSQEPSILSLTSPGKFALEFVSPPLSQKFSAFASPSGGSLKSHSAIPAVILAVLALVVPASRALAEEQALPPQPSFALVSPASATGLATKKAWPDAEALISHATLDLKSTPHPLARLHTEGTLPHQGIYDQSRAAGADFFIMRDLGIAYRLTGNPRFLKAVDSYLEAWTSVYQLSFNPIDETHLDQMIIAYDLVKGDLSETTRDQMTAFLQKMAEGYAAAVVQKKDDPGNWQSHRVKLLTLSAFALGDADLIDKAHAAFLQHLETNIRPDGSVYDFYQRDALHYVIYDLEPLTIACLAAQEHGRDWYHETNSGSVATAINWLLPYETGKQTHEEFLHSSVKFDQARAEAGLGAYSPHTWEPAETMALWTTVAALDPAQRTVCLGVASKVNKTPERWLYLLFWPTP